jgi:hypothetical protein
LYLEATERGAKSWIRFGGNARHGPRIDTQRSGDQGARNRGEWAFSLRKIMDADDNFVCFDDCESLGKWPWVLSDNDHFVDVNCYFLPKSIAPRVSPIWYCGRPASLTLIAR